MDDKEKRRSEILVQCEVFRELDPQNINEVDIHIASEFAVAFREMMLSFEQDFGRVPTSAEIIWCVGVNTNQNPREVVASWVEQSKGCQCSCQ